MTLFPSDSVLVTVLLSKGCMASVDSLVGVLDHNAFVSWLWHLEFLGGLNTSTNEA